MIKSQLNLNFHNQFKILTWKYKKNNQINNEEDLQEDKKMHAEDKKDNKKEKVSFSNSNNRIKQFRMFSKMDNKFQEDQWKLSSSNHNN